MGVAMPTTAAPGTVHLQTIQSGQPLPFVPGSGSNSTTLLGCWPNPHGGLDVWWVSYP